MFKRTRRTFNFIFNTNVTSWISLDQLIYKFRYFISSANQLSSEKKADENIKFEEALEKHQLTEHEIKKKEKYFIVTFLLFFILSSSILVLAIFNLIKLNILSCIISLAATFITFIQGCKYHYYYFCLKNKVTSCTFNEWFNGDISRG